MSKYTNAKTGVDAKIIDTGNTAGLDVLNELRAETFADGAETTEVVKETTDPIATRDEAINQVLDVSGITKDQVLVDPIAYGQAGRDLGVILDETYEDTSTAWSDPNLSQGDELIGRGPMANRPEQPGIDVQKRNEAFDDWQRMDATDWVDKWDTGVRQDDKPKTVKDIDNFLEQSGKVKESLDNIIGKFSGAEAQFFSQALANKKGFKPESVLQFMNGIVTNYANLKENGTPQAASDLLMMSYLKTLKDNEWLQMKDSLAKGSKAKKAGVERVADEDLVMTGEKTQQRHDTDLDAQAGRLFNETMGADPTPENNAIAGALARKTVGDALPGFFEEKIARTGKADGMEYGYKARKLSSTGSAEVNRMLKFIDRMMPNETNVIRNVKKAEAAQKFARIRKPNRADKGLTYGNFDMVNDFKAILENTGHRYMTSANGELTTHGLITAIASNEATLNLFDQEGFKDISMILDETTGAYRRKDKRADGYVANDVKDMMFRQTLELISGQNGNVIYYDYNLGLNNRFYQVSNGIDFQSDKLARSMLEAAEKFTYNLNSSHVSDMRAGIMKKFGYDKLNVAAAEAKFLEHINEWSTLLANPIGNAKAITSIAAKEEGYASLSAMVEAVKFEKAYKDRGNNSTYRSGFYTEIDGVANGVAHGVLQSGGDKKVQNAVNIFSGEALAQMSKGEWNKATDGSDVYAMTSESVLAKLKDPSSANEDVARWILKNFVDSNGNTLIGRKFGKKPMMIFSYGAGPATIKKTIAGYVNTLLAANPDIATQLSSVKFKEQVVNLIADTTNEAVENEFASVKEFTSTMSAIATFAAAAGLPPIITTYGGHEIRLGDISRQASPEFGSDRVNKIEQAIKDTYKTKDLAKRKKLIAMKSKLEGGYVQVGDTYAAVQRNINNPTSSYKDSNDNIHYRAATQAGVLGTHANDAINLAMTFGKMDGESHGNVAAQVFDGVFVPPGLARKYAKQLNDDFYKLNREFGAAERFFNEIKDRLPPNTRYPRDLEKALNRIVAKRKVLFKHLQAKQIKQFFWN